MRQVGCNVEREPMKRNPAFDPHPERADFDLARSVAYPNADPAFCAMRRNTQFFERVDHPPFERVDEAANILSAFFEIEHHIADALTRSVISIAAAPPGLVNRKLLRVGELRDVRASAGREQ